MTDEEIYKAVFETILRNTKLLNERFYVSERALVSAAKEAGVAHSNCNITVNNWNYSLVRAGGVCLMQAYVQSASEMARPSRFRETHAAVNDFLKAPQLALGDIDPEIFDTTRLNGILIHGPVGKDFSENDQALSFLNFAIPDPSYTVWGMNVGVSEIIARFEHTESGIEIPQRDIAKPRIKRPAARRKEQE